MALILYSATQRTQSDLEEEFDQNMQTARENVTIDSRDAVRMLNTMDQLIGSSGQGGLAQVAGPQGVNTLIRYGLDDMPASQNLSRSVLQTYTTLNRQSMNSSIRYFALVAKGLELVENVPPSYNEIVVERDTLASQMDAELGRTTDPELYASMTDFREAFVTDMTTQARTRPQLVAVDVPVQENALALAYELYGDASRADEVIARNNISAPGIIDRRELLALSV